jgi:hypothetical protein
MESKIWRVFVTGVFTLFFMCGRNPILGNNPPFEPVETPHSVGVIQGRITDPLMPAQSSGIASANVIAYTANTNVPFARVFSDTEGYYTLYVMWGGTFNLKVAAQGYKPYPDANVPPSPFVVPVNDTVIKDISLAIDTASTSTGNISGTVRGVYFGGTFGFGGVLVVATRSSDSLAVSGVSACPTGFFVLYNIPAGTYNIRCYDSGYTQISDTSVTVAANTALTGITLYMSNE